MSVFTIPKCYENKIPIGEAGAHIRKIGKHALILAGKTAFDTEGDKLKKTLEKNGISYKVVIARGYPTEEKAQQYSRQALENKNDFIIAVGGGKIMDVSKAAAYKAGIPIVTIPTVAATCAAWSTLSVLYTEQGKQDSYLYTKESPVLIIVDKEVLFKAPRKFLISGVVDSIVKWYEVTSNYNGNQYNFELRLQIKICELILECLEKEFVDAALEDYNSIPEEIRENAIDAIILLAGLSGSINGNVPYGGLAHHFYNQATHVDATHIRLHGEIVMYGLFVQLVIEGEKEAKIKGRMWKMRQLGVPVTLSDLGIVENIEESVDFIAGRISERVRDYAPAERTLTKEIIKEAIFKVDAYGRGIKDEGAK